MPSSSVRMKARVYTERLAAETGEDTQERNGRKLEALRMQPGTDNAVCADCGTGERTSWANLSFGVFICMTCAGLHRKLALKQGGGSAGVTDDWTRDEIDALASQGGNRVVNLALNPGKEQPPPAGDIGQLEMFMRAKYETRALHKQHVKRMQKRHQKEQQYQQEQERERERSSRSRDQPAQSDEGASVGSQPTWKQTPQEPQQEQPLVSVSQPQPQPQSQPQVQVLPASNNAATAAPLQFYSQPQQPLQYHVPQMMMSYPQQQHMMPQQMVQPQYVPQQYVYQQPAMQMMPPQQQQQQQQQQMQMPQYQYMSFQQQPQQMFYQ